MKLKLLSLGLASLFVTTSAVAVEEDFTASVTVQNVLELTEDQALSFGTIRAQPDTDTIGDSVSTVTINPNNTSDATVVNTAGDGTGDSAIQVLEEGSPASFTVGGAASFAQLTVTFPADGTVSLSTGAPGASEFVLNGFSGYVSTGANSGTTFATTETITANATGELAFNVGATLATDETNTTAYNDGDYTGTYTIIVEY